MDRRPLSCVQMFNRLRRDYPADAAACEALFRHIYDTRYPAGLPAPAQVVRTTRRDGRLPTRRAANQGRVRITHNGS
jgi:hypothetical protein